MSRNLFLIILVLFGFNPNQISVAQNSKVDSLLALLKTEKYDTSRVNHLNDLSFELRYQKPDSSILFGNEALYTLETLPKSSKSNTAIIALFANTYSNLASSYYLKGDYYQAQHLFSKALNLDESIGRTSKMGSDYANVALCFTEQGEYTKALEYNKKAIKLHEELGDKKRLLTCLVNVGIIYRTQESYSTALSYFTNALKIAENIGDRYGVARTLSSIGNMHLQQGEYQKALDVFFKASKVLEGLENKSYKSNLLGNIGDAYFRSGNNEAALRYLLEALKISEEIGENDKIAIWVGDLSSVYIKQKKYKDAFNCLYRAIALDEKSGSLYGIHGDYENLSDLYEVSSIPLPDTIGGKLLNSEQMRLRAIYYFEKSNAINDLLFSEQNKKKLVQQELQAEFDKKEALSKIENEKKISLIEEENVRQKSVNWIAFLGILLVLIFWGTVFRSLKIVRKQKQLIEEKNAETELQKLEIEKKTKDIIDSINYAKRIQNALLREEEYVSKHLPEHFILFMPKDIVSGDFYWAAEKGVYWYVAVADCTGHGVPGAIMSMLGISFLNEIIHVKETLEPAEILNRLREKIVIELQQKNESIGNKDGMDISLCQINLTTFKLQWAGANNSLNYIQNGKPFELKADKQPIGYHLEERPFTNHKIQLQQGDCVYMYSDGYADQFGGSNGKKFKYKQLDELILLNSRLAMENQKEVLKKQFVGWKGKLEQVDDVCIIGIRL